MAIQNRFLQFYAKPIPKHQLDGYDRRILEAPAEERQAEQCRAGRAEACRLSPCLRRVRMLEDAGVIQGYEARLAPDEVGLGLTVFVGVKVERHHERDAARFRKGGQRAAGSDRRAPGVR